ncbi:DUF2586 domain-containing protein [Desulfovibrio cuneatus]|uniref:DUF2586 domain-containing protein n=1 Tax=Desulfovibrio cuneatus TaxID=159728 RepID=UPI000408FA8F|nr:DUF2586 domain-containing protein [Desulfovibrio cuneatus]
MALGAVKLNNLNLRQGPLREVENYFLYVGAGAGKNVGKLVAVNTETDLAASLGAGPLAATVAAARYNAGQEWNACVLPLAPGQTWEAGVDFAIEHIGVEAVIITDPVETVADLERQQQKAMQIMARDLLPMWFGSQTRGIKPTETWEEYVEALRPITKNIAAPNVLGPTPPLWGPELGTLAGRLANKSVTIADSPMRVLTGPLVGEWTTRPVDAAGRVLDRSILQTLDAARFSVPQWYPGYDGTYWADGNVLDVEGGDYQTIENLRVVQKAMRRVYPLAVARIADRALNETPASIAKAKQYFTRPLREMAKSRQIRGWVFPGEIHPPTEQSITITWHTKYSVELFIAVQPYNCPKQITCNILLDLENYA